MKSPIPCLMSCTATSTAAFRSCRRQSCIRTIVFFYGSIVRVYGNVGRDELYRQLTRILHHEVRHHNEYLAGTDDLGLWDDDQILDYLKKNGVKPKK